MSLLGEAFVRIRPETSGFQGEAESGVTSAVKKVAIAVGGIFAAEKVFDFGKSALEDAANVQKSQEAIQFEYGKSGKAVESFAKGAAANLGISTATSEKSAASFGVLFKNIGVGHAKAAEMTVGFQKLAGSLSLIKNVNPATSLDALTTAVAGNTRGLRSLGIVVTPAAEQLYAATHGIINTSGAVAIAQSKWKLASDAYSVAVQKYGKGSSEATKALNVQKAALQGIQKAHAGLGVTLTSSEKAQAIYGLATQHLSEYQKEAKKSSGNLADQEEILGAKFDNLKLSIGEKLLPVVTSLLGFLLRNKSAVIDVAKAGLVLGGTISILLGAYKAYVVVAKQAALVTALFTEAEGEADAAMVANPIGLIITAIGLLVVGLYEAYEHWGAFRDVVNEAAAGVKRAAAAALPYVVEALHDIVKGLKYVEPYLAAFVKLNEQAFAQVVGYIRAAVAEAISLWNRFSLIRTITEDVLGVVRNVVKSYMTIIQGIIETVMGLIHGNWSEVWQGLKTIATGVLHGIEAVVSGAAGILGAAASRLGQAIWNGIVNKVKTIPGLVGRLVGEIPGAIGDLGSTLYNAGVALMTGLLNGIKHAYDSVKNFVSGIAGDIAGLKGPLDYDRQLLVPHGKAIMAGLHEGLLAGYDPVKKLVGGIAPAIAPTVTASIAGQGSGGVGVHISGPVTIQTATPEAFLAWANQQTRMAVA